MVFAFLLSFFVSTQPLPTETNPTPTAESMSGRTCEQGSSNGDCWLKCYDDSGMMINSSYCAQNQDGSHTCENCRS